MLDQRFVEIMKKLSDLQGLPLSIPSLSSGKGSLAIVRTLWVTDQL